MFRSTEDESNELVPRPPRWTSPEIDEIISRRGGLFLLNDDDIDSIKGFFRAITSNLDRRVEFAESGYTVRPRRISYGFISSYDFNAFAYATPPSSTHSIDFVGINIGIVFTLHNTFARILSHPLTFPDVGNPALEDETRNNQGPLISNVMSPPMYFSNPNCPIRSRFSSILAQTALDYLFLHEITHLRYGHLEYIREKFQFTYLAEIADSGSTPRSMINQTLEMDADCGALANTISLAFYARDLVTTTPQNYDPQTLSLLQAAYGDTKRATRTVIYAVYAMFHLFNDCGWNLSVQSSTSHPLPSVRMSWIIPTLTENLRLQPKYGYDPTTAMIDSLQTAVSILTDIGRIKGVLPDLDEFKRMATSSEAREYLNELTRMWTFIRPSLEKYKRGGRLPD